VSRYAIRLNASQSYASVDLPFHAVDVAISNPTASPVYVRIGAPDIPTSVNADLILPAAKSETFPVSGRTFGLAIGDPASIAGGVSAKSGLFSSVLVVFLSEGEQIPTYGNFDFQSLSISDLSGGVVAFANGTTQTYDLGAWGGVIIFIAPTAGAGQGVAVVQASADNVLYYTMGTYAFWPGIPASLILPRPVRYMRITFGSSGIAGEPAAAGFFSARASLAEINQITYSPGGLSVTQAYNIPNLGEANKIFATHGVSAIAVSVANTTGSNGGELIIETSQFAAGPWQTVAYREQIVNPAGPALTASIFRTFGNLGPFTRVRLLSTGTSGALVGTIYYSMVVAADLNGMLQNIYAALGDVGQPTNTNQSIYHELDHIRVDLDSIQIASTYLFALANIEIWTHDSRNLETTHLPKLTDIYNLENGYLPYLQTISNNEATYLPYLSTYLPYLQTINGALSAINTAISNINTVLAANQPELPTIRANTGSTNANVATLTTYPAAVSLVSSTQIATFVANGFNLLLTPFWQSLKWLIALRCTIMSPNVVAGGGTWYITHGTGGSAAGPLYSGIILPNVIVNTPTQIFDGPRSGGYQIPSGQTGLWFFWSPVAAANIVLTVDATFAP
jgi:hypothetical protein